MKKNKKGSSIAPLTADIVFVLSLPLLAFKWLGDIIITLGKLLLSLEFKTYKNISAYLIRRFKNPLSKTAYPKISRPKVTVVKKNLFGSFSLFSYLNPPLAKRKIVFRARKSGRLILNNLKRKIKLPKFPIIGEIRAKIISFPFWILFLKIKYFLLGAVVIALLAALYEINAVVSSLPDPVYLSQRDIPTSTKIFDRQGKLLYEIYDDQNRTPVKLSDIPAPVKMATIAIEDREFYSHQGISFKGIFRSLLHDLNNGYALEGGSTITQQLIRSAVLTPEKTLSRKVKEAALSLWAEEIYSKDQILEMYLNQVPYGGTAWGIEAASQTYFGKSVKELTLPEAALLAGLPAAPTLYSPFGAHPELAKQRQVEVLNQMVSAGYLKKEDAQKAAAEPLRFRRPVVPIAAPHFVMYVRQLLEQQYGERAVERGGLRVITTLDLSLQEMAQRIVSDNIDKLHSLKVGNGAALITDPQTGEILAMVGSSDYFNSDNDGNVNLTLALRQPGSSIKVVNYAAALQKGFTAASILNDTPVAYGAPGEAVYSPVNYDGRFHGNVPLRVALASSYNIPAVRTLAAIGVDTMISQGKLMGIENWDENRQYGLSLTLGGGEVTMLDMATVYDTLANKGIRRKLTPFISVTNWRGEVLSPAVNNDPVYALPPGVAYILSSILSDNTARTPAFGPNSALLIPAKTVAVKTGTSDNKKDNWTIGFTPNYTVSVWVGNNDGSPMDPQLTSGVTGAAPIWHDIMTALIANQPDKPFEIPDDVISLPCYGRNEFFLKGTAPKGGCAPLVYPSPTPGK